ncbi:CapA family protein [Paenibacillus gansuensis]|uniref:CapA family protein n=1 Tax=Paenibacillus gansuensis TaxID=306542 RepID=A0ABW5PCA0_9BACL
MKQRAVALLIILCLSILLLPSVQADTGPVSMTFAGDVLLDGYVGNQIKKNGTAYPFQKVAPVLRAADISFVNLETPVSVRGSKLEGKMFTFRSEPKTLDGLVYAGVDGVTLANNHILDYGQTAMLDTLVHLDRKGIGHTGAGKDAEQAFRPFIKNVKGRKIAIVGVTRVMEDRSWHAGTRKPGAASAFTDKPMLDYIKKTAGQSDFTVVYVHWNKEFSFTPEAYARDLARKLIDNGVDLVVGAHSHTLMGAEFYKHKPIFYSLGNFVFNQSTRGGAVTTLSMMLKVYWDGSKTTTAIVPAKISGGQPRLMDQAFNQSIIAHVNRYSYNAKVSSNGVVKEK